MRIEFKKINGKPYFGFFRLYFIISYYFLGLFDSNLNIYAILLGFGQRKLLCPFVGIDMCFAIFGRFGAFSISI